MEVLITNTDCHNKVEMQCSNCIAPLQCSVQHKDLDVYLSFLLERSSSPSSQPEHSIEVSDERLTIKITGLQPNTEYRAAITANDHQDMIQTISVEFHTGQFSIQVEIHMLRNTMKPY
jgi:hypothetical protein